MHKPRLRVEYMHEHLIYKYIMLKAKLAVII